MNPHPSILERVAGMKPEEFAALCRRWHLDPGELVNLAQAHHEAHGGPGPIRDLRRELLATAMRRPGGWPAL